MQILSSRRLTGPHLLLPRPGAVIDAELSPADAALPALWERHARRLLAALGWEGETIVVRRFPGGASLAFTAPVDVLYAATDINEWAWAAAVVEHLDGAELSLDEARARFRRLLRRQHNPPLLALAAAAEARGIAWFSDDHWLTVGLGTGAHTWPVDALPAPEEVDWTEIHDVPVALATGTNGKTTTVRLAAAMLRAAGKTAGLSSTDQVQVGDEVLEQGDFSGPGGARTVLRDPRVEAAVLETARGGILRRGLAVSRAQAAVVTNVAADHLGEFGVGDLATLAETKLVVTRVVEPAGRVVLNADAPELAARAAQRFPAPVVWFSLDPGNPLVRAHRAAGGEACLLADGVLGLARGAEWLPVIPAADVPLSFGGAARFNLANALAALGLAAALGVPVPALAEGLRRFASDPALNPGRGNLFERRGVRILLDYAHNPHGLDALRELAATFPAARRLLLIGHAGDRDDDAIRALARSGWQLRPDRIVIKEMTALLRGREPGEVPALLAGEFHRLGAAPESVVHTESELAGVEEALRWARPGDLLVLLVHTDREAVLARLEGDA